MYSHSVVNVEGTEESFVIVQFTHKLAVLVVNLQLHGGRHSPCQHLQLALQWNMYTMYSAQLVRVICPLDMLLFLILSHSLKPSY